MDTKEIKDKLWQNHDASFGTAAGWLKGTSEDKVTLSSAKIKLIALAVIETRFSECISKSVSQKI